MVSRINDQKLFYWLLYNHRESQLENYNNNVPISKSDFHHLKPPNWGKRVSTCQFTQPGRNGHARTVSRFTVISNVPNMDDAGTIRSYDPYNASCVLQPCPSQASHAKVTVHHNNPGPGVGPSPLSISHSYRSYRSAAGSFRQRQRMNSQRTSIAGHLRSPLSSMSSIRSQHSTPRVRAASRSKRGVDFSNVRNKGRRHHRDRPDSITGPASIAGDSTTYDRDSFSPSSPPQEPVTQEASTIQPTVEACEHAESSLIWNEELEQLGHSIAQDCDEAFRSSLLSPEHSEAVAESREASPFTISLGSLSAIRLSEDPDSPDGSCLGVRPWDNRPLPPVPSHETVSPLSIRNTGPNIDTGLQTKTPSALHSSLGALPERRTVSEPVYNRPIKAARPLPSIHENGLEGCKRRNLSKQYLASPLGATTRVRNTELDYLSRAENTIRVVNSPAAAGALDPVKAPEPLNVRKVSRNTATMNPTLTSAVDPRQDTSHGSHQKNQLVGGGGGNVNIPPKKRVSSWFKRASKEDTSSSSFVTVTDTSVQSKETIADSEASHPNQTISQLTDAPSASRASKKRGFGFSFWKSTKGELKNSLTGKQEEHPIGTGQSHLTCTRWAGGTEPNDTRIQGNENTTSKKANTQDISIIAGAGQSVWSDSDGGGRKIEVQQNWLARLFRVKPAMRYLCFNVPKRRARQEVAILLREWRKYGIRDVEVDKERNILFARLAAKNCKSSSLSLHSWLSSPFVLTDLNLKEVSFAIELMTVIEHGKRNQLSIARFTQEKGAASSFHKVVDAISTVFTDRTLVITDKRKINMMIKTLNS